MKIDYNRTLMNHMGVYLDKPAAKSQDVFLECIEMIEKKKNIKEFDNSKKSIRKILKYYGEVRSNPESENDKKYTILKLFRFQHPSEETYYIFVLVIAREYTYLIKLVRNEKKIDNVTLINELEAFEDIEICEESAEIKKNDSYGTVVMIELRNKKNNQDDYLPQLYEQKQPESAAGIEDKLESFFWGH